MNPGAAGPAVPSGRDGRDGRLEASASRQSESPVERAAADLLGELSGADASLQRYLQDFHQFLESGLTGGLWAEATPAAGAEGVVGRALFRPGRLQTPREVVGIAAGALMVGLLMLAFLMSI